ncbi:PIG-L family deacetylase [Pacificoceanicola onchidii]|uniref:PIG-L family deacetylase n=1 Tax=Pacificoceanicola onchidii TaxID=2562685 RepID=UPI00197ED7FD|nr:PIG-L family deacetylase [Pacificoceanicola onchidii]
MPPVDPLAPYSGADIDGAFALTVTLRVDDLSGSAWQTVFDFGTATGANTVSLMQVGNSADLLLYIFQDGQAYRLVANDALVEGAEQAFSVGVDAGGRMWIESGGTLLAEGPGAVPLDVPRDVQLVGMTDWAGGSALDGEILSFDLVNEGDVPDDPPPPPPPPPPPDPVEPPEPEPVPDPVDPPDPGTPGVTGGVFAITATARFDDIQGGSWQRVYDFGDGPASNNILFGQVENTSDMMLEFWQDGVAYRVVAEGAIVEGEEAEWVSGVDAHGVMYIEKDGVRLAEAQGIVPEEAVRQGMLVGESNWPEDSPLIGAVLDISVATAPPPEEPEEPEDPEDPEDPEEPEDPEDPEEPEDPEDPEEPEDPEDPEEPEDPTAPGPIGTGGEMFIVAHQDDDLLFMNPTLLAQIESGEAVTTVYQTAGDAGEDEAYWSAREAGMKAAYANMAGVENAWIDETVEVSQDGQTYALASSYLEDAPQVRLYFLRTPDGFGDGSGSEAQDGQSLQKLWEGTIPEVTTVDGAATYTAEDMTALTAGLMALHQPDHIHIQDFDSPHTDLEHSDHVFGAHFAVEAAESYAADFTLTSYTGYATWGFEENVEGDTLDAVRSAFLEYASYDYKVFAPDGTLIDAYREWMMREYVQSETVYEQAAEPASAFQHMLTDGILDALEAEYLEAEEDEAEEDDAAFA